MKKTPFLIAAFVVSALALVAGLQWSSGPDASAKRTVSRTTATPAAPARPPTPVEAPDGSALGVTDDAPPEPRSMRRSYFAPSLRGTTVDGRLQADDDGDLVVTRSTRDVFDYFLSTYGEHSLEEIVAHIEEYARRSLQEKAAAQAIELLGDYVAYKKAAQAYLRQGMTPSQRENRVDTLEQVSRRLAAMRRQYFTPAEAEAMFGVEADYQRYALARMRVRSNEALSDAEKAERLARIDAQAPPVIRAVKQRTLGYAQRAQRVETMRANGASKAEIRRYRTRQVGAEEARRLARIDAANADWKKRYARYTKQRQNIVDSTGLSGADKKAAIERLRERYFEPDEMARVRVTDRVEARAGEKE